MKISGFRVSGLGVRVWGTSSDRHKGARLGIILGFPQKNESPIHLHEGFYPEDSSAKFREKLMETTILYGAV